MEPLEKPCRVDLYPGRELVNVPHHSTLSLGVDLVEQYVLI